MILFLRCFIPCLTILVFTWSGLSHSGEFKDSLGRTIILKREPSRIISLAPSITEILYYVELGDRVVGVTKFSYYPPEALNKPVIGSYVDLNIEKIISLDPDLVIGTADGNEPKIVNLLGQAGIEVFIINPRDIRSVIDSIAAIGRVCGVKEKADQMVRDLSCRVDRVIRKVEARKKPLVFLQINLRPIMTVNHNTFHHDLIGLAGGINMARDMPFNYPAISIEEILRLKPDVMIISRMDRKGSFEKARDDWMKWHSIPAVQNNRVFLIDSDLIDRPSPRVIDGLEAMAGLIHPEADWSAK
ncbi:MAG: cobalamin-binding protein [Deltaproteobacteria bacterium]|nr:cobalamin-binding protein [Deltaproteobacteria bacterium]